MIASGKADFSLESGFASNGFEAHSPGGYSMVAALVCEVVMTMMFLLIILGSTDKRAPAWTENLADPKRHAVAAQFWGERVLRFFRQRGYWNRDHKGSGGKTVPARVLIWYGASTTKFNEVTLFWLKPEEASASAAPAQAAVG